MAWVDEDADLGRLINRRVREYDLGQRSEDAEVLGERKLGHHLDCAAAMRTCVGASFNHLPDATDDVVKSLPRPLCRYGSRSTAAAVPRHPASVQGAAVWLRNLRWSFTHLASYLFPSTTSPHSECSASHGPGCVGALPHPNTLKRCLANAVETGIRKLDRSVRPWRQLRSHLIHRAEELIPEVSGETIPATGL